MTRGRRLIGAASVTLAVGCAAGTSPAEYALYRKSRVAPSIEDRLGASMDYLRHYPKGAFKEDVAAHFTRDELLYYRSKNKSVQGLASYLRALPAGPHGVEATGRLSAMRSKGTRSEQALKQGLASSAQLERAIAARARVRDETIGWVDRFLDPAVFRAPIAEAPSELLVAWSLGLPAPRCAEVHDPRRARVARRCEKVEELAYVVVTKDGKEEREATLSVAMDQDPAGRPVSVSIGGPELFLRLEEAGVVRAFDRDDAEHRIGAVARAVALLRGEFQKRVSRDAACEKPVVAPVVLDLSCSGVSLRARAGVEPGEEDEVVIREASPP